MIRMPAPRQFLLERYFSKHEFATRYMLSASDCESMSISEVLTWADANVRSMWESLTLGYTETQGHSVLRAQIASTYEDLTHGSVLVMAPEEAIFIGLHSLLSPDDHVVCISPCYQSLLEVPRLIGCDLTEWRLVADRDEWRLDFDALEEALRPNTRVLIVNFPHNPTGYQPTRILFEKILNLAQRRGIWVFSDEMYRLLEFRPDAKLPAACEIYDKAISLGGLSKAFGMPGLRIGWLASRDKQFLDRCIGWRDYTTICNSAPSEVLAIAALTNKQRILSRNMEIVCSNLEAAHQFFTSRPVDLHWRKPSAGAVAIVEWRGRPALDEIRLRLLDREVLIAPGPLFNLDMECFRLGLGRRDFPQALAIFANVTSYG